MNNENDHWNEQEVDALIDYFERMLHRGESFFFDVDDYTMIIDHYIDIIAIEKSQLALKHAMEQHPHAIIFQVKKAQLLAITHNKEQALQMLSRVENMEPYNTDIIRTKANIFSQLQQYSNAIKEYKKLSAEEDAEEVFSNIAFEYENMGQYFMAIKYLKKVMVLNPQNENALYELAYCFEVSGRLEESADYFRQHLEDHPFCITAWFNLGVSCSTLDRLDEALDAFEFAIALEPNYASGYFNKASVLCNQGKYYEAIEAYKETINLENPEALTYHYIAECYEKTRDFDSAAEYYFKSIEENESLAEAWAGLGSVFYETGENVKAIKFVEKARKLNNNIADFALLHGDILKSQQDYAGATEAYDHARQLNEADEEIWLDLAEVIALRDEDISRGIEILEKASNLFPDNASILYRLSYYLLSQQREKEALFTLQNALHLNYNKLSEFLNMDDKLIEHRHILEIIEQVKQEKQKR